MFKFALKNMAIKKVKIVLIVISIVISACVGILAYNISEQIDSGFKTTAGYYDMIIGPSGSATQLAMNTMFFTEKPLGTISYEYVEELQQDMRVNKVVPFTMGDSYNGAKIVGTTPDFLEGKQVADGEMYDEKFECVVGSAVAEKYGLSLGDSLITSHGLAEGGSEHEGNPLTVVGILKSTKTAYDNVIFTPIETVWATHDHEEEGEEEEHEEHAEHGEICAILVKSKSFNSYNALKTQYSENTKLLVINPSEVLREVLENVDMSTKIVYILCLIILIMNIFIISVITLLNMYDSKKEIALMRLIGIGMNKINLVYIIQNGIIGLVSTLLAFAASRLCLLLMGSYVASMGIVLDTAKIYPMELIIMAVVFVISVLPTVICTVSMSKKDGISE
ncbi:MAG: ABC transporter permease [Oscillospiraceae bacterium]|nr:ABC transporter permease [Oscillospiraceae bacterium]MDD6145860.1 ABC transporter permease [Oscillospiraceae bacterium]